MRALLEVADILRQHGSAFRAAHAGHLSLGQLKVMTAIEACRTAALGGHVEGCEDCGHRRIAYNSCHNRHCPKCQGTAAREWLAAREADLLPVGYFHVVFSLPAEVATIAAQNKAAVYDLLFRAASETMLTIAAAWTAARSSDRHTGRTPPHHSPGEKPMFSTRAEDNKALVLEAFDTLLNRRDYQAAKRFWSPDYIQHSAHIAPGREGLFDLVRTAPSELRYEPGLILADEEHVMIHGRFSGTGRPHAWIAVDVVRIADGLLAEHWDVLQDEASSGDSRSGRSMFGDAFPTVAAASKVHRRVVTGHRNGRSIVLSDQQRPAYSFRTLKGFEQTYMWAADGIVAAEPEVVDLAMSESALPAPGGSLVQIVTFPPAGRPVRAADSTAIAQEYLARLPGLAETFERDGSQMHVTQTLDYAIILDGELWLELDDGEPTHLSTGDVVVQQATRHGWRNKGSRPATIAFVMLGA